MLLDAASCLRIRSRSLADPAFPRGRKVFGLFAKLGGEGDFLEARMREQGRDRLCIHGPPAMPADAWAVQHIVSGAGERASGRRDVRAREPHWAHERSCQCARQRLEFIRKTPMRGLSAGERAARHAANTFSMTVENLLGRSASGRSHPPPREGVPVNRTATAGPSAGSSRLTALAPGSKRSYFATLSRSRAASFDSPRPMTSQY